MTADEDADGARTNLLNALYSSVSDVPAWTSFAAVARTMFGCDQAAVAVGEAGGGAPVVAAADDAWPDALSALIAGLPGCRDDRCTPIEAGEGCGLALRVGDGSSGHAAILLWRAGAAAGFDPRSAALLASLADPLRRSLRIYHRVVDLVRRASIAELALETSHIGVALVDADGAVVLANSVAAETFATGEGLRLTRGRLHAETAAATATLMREIRASALSQAAEVDPLRFAALPFERASHALPLTVIVRPGPGFHPLPRPLRQTAILVIRDPAAQAAWPAATLARLFNLSAAEALLASELARGASLDEAAAALGISRNTVRSQLQGIFLKTGINRQSDLIRALLNSAATST